jgi:hypothetical protein
MYRDNKEIDGFFFKIIVLGLLSIVITQFFLLGCVSKPKIELTPIPQLSETPKPVYTVLPTVLPIPVPEPVISLSWEKNHPERAAWSKILMTEISDAFETLDKAKDINIFCPKYTKALTKAQKLNAWGEFFVWLAYYESGWDEKEMDQDVGDAGDFSTYSTGLFQVSAIDIEAYSLQKVLHNYSYKDLQTVEPNIKLAMALMSRQILRQGLICVSSNVYWSTLSNKFYAPYQKIDEISSRVKTSIRECGL